jgi:hypothetical protein
MLSFSSSNSNPSSPITPDKKLKKQPQKGFDFDMTPVMGQEMVVEEAFHIFCVLICGSRWEELSIDERGCNWALVCTDYLCSLTRANDVCRSNSNPILEKATAILFEEYIPS